MCLAVQQMIDEATVGIRQEGKISTTFANIKNLVVKLGLSLEESMDALEVCEEDRKNLKK